MRRSVREIAGTADVLPSVVKNSRRLLNDGYLVASRVRLSIGTRRGLPQFASVLRTRLKQQTARHGGRPRERREVLCGVGPVKSSFGCNSRTDLWTETAARVVVVS